MMWWEEILSKLKQGDAVVRLMTANVIVFLSIQLVYIFSSLMLKNVLISTHPDLYLAASSDMKIMLHRPWSVITHMFTHKDVGHFIFNAFCLYTGGRIFQTFFSNKQLVTNYILGGLSGYFLYALFYNIFPAFSEESYVLGASAAVMAIIFAIGTVQPNFTVKLFGVFEMKMIWLCAVLVLVDLIGIRKGFNSGGHIGHLGGALFGFIYGRQHLKGKVMGNGLTRLIDRLRSLFGANKSHLKTVHKRPISDEEFNAEKNRKQKRVDQILDKIGRSGYESLSREEKDFLFKYSQK